MVFQPVLAGSKNVDIVYGKNDKIPLVIMNMGNEKKVNLKVTVKSTKGKTLFEKVFPNVTLPAGRSFTNLSDWNPRLKSEGFYIFEYEVLAITE
ncbi:MAG: hypothetical protein KAR17_12705, partial [Cyclobacteriaceae bacterium]|nr:hypothetical protein [Cyclobacteriaceae bacterium]